MRLCSRDSEPFDWTEPRLARCHRAGCNTWRTLEWILPHPPPFHTFEEQPIIKETVGAATVTP